MKKLLPVIGTVLVLSCSKKNNDFPAPFLNFSQNTVSLTPVPGASTEVIVESNIDWQLSLPTGANWLKADKTSGHGNDTIHLTVLADNSGNASRTATLTASPVNTATPLSAQLTIEQKPYNVRLLSQKVLGGAGLDELDIVIPVSDGGVLLGGYTTSNQTGLVGKNHGSYDYWMVRLNSNNDTLWTRLLGGPGGDLPMAGVATADGGFAIAGYTTAAGGDITGTFAGGNDWWIIKLNSKGDTVWTRLMGGAFTDLVQGIANTADGGLVIAGCKSSSNSSSGRDGWVVKLNSSGNMVWQQTLGGTAVDMINAVSVATNGTILLAGYSFSTTTGNNHGSADMWVVKLTGDGNMVYTKLFGGNSDDRANSIVATADGGCIVAGYTESNNSGDVGANKGMQDFWVLQLTAGGDTTFTKTLGGSKDECAFSVAVTTDGGYIVAGSTNSTDGDIANNHGDNDIWSLKLNKSGQLLWSKTFGGSGYEFADKMAIGANNTIYVTGYTDSNSTGDVGAFFGSGDAWFFKFTDY